MNLVFIYDGANLVNSCPSFVGRGDVSLTVKGLSNKKSVNRSV